MHARTNIVEHVKALAETNPAALGRRQEPGGQLPIHKACTWGASLVDVILALLSSLPKCGEKRFLILNLPYIVHVIFRGVRTNVIEELLHVYPQSVWQRNNQVSSAIDMLEVSPPGIATFRTDTK